MSQTPFTISYQSLPAITFPNSTAMRKYLENELSAWDAFSQYLESSSPIDFATFNGAADIRTFKQGLNHLIQNLSNVATFNQKIQSHNRICIPPPSSSSLEGQLILGLVANDRKNDARAAYVWFMSQEKNIQDFSRETTDLIARGRSIFLGALATQALPFREISAQNMAARTKAAQAQVAALGVEVTNAQATNNDHRASLEAFRGELKETAEGWWSRFKRVEGLLFRRERNRRKKSIEFQSTILKEANRSLRLVGHRLKNLDEETARIQAARQAEHDALIKLLKDQFRFDAPVELWDARAKDHAKASEEGLTRFIGLGTLTIFVAALVPFVFGNYIAGSFHACGLVAKEGCVDGFSAKGPLTVGGLLLIMSVLMWAVRLQYRIFLSERHLSLDASEKKAFAQTYLAIKSESKVDAASEAIVLAALFRPTQDGIIKDDEGGLDFSAASILARQFSKPN
jgi:hypothetical protein